MKKYLIVLLFAFLGEAKSAIYYSATNGLPSNSGTLASPWDLWTSLNKTNLLVGGDFILLLEGSYTNYPVGYITNANAGSIFFASIHGIPGNNITIMPYSNAVVVLDGQAFGGRYKYHSQDDAPVTRSTLKIGDPNNPLVGHNLTFLNLEITSSSTEARYSIDDSPFAPNLTRGAGVGIYGRSNIVANCYVHDLMGGIDSWGAAGGSIIYGNTLYNNGWMGSGANPHRHGHNIYTQSFTTSAPRYITNNFLFNPYDNNYQAFGSSAAYLVHYRIFGNTVISGDALLGGRTDVVTFDNQITGNFHYNSDLDFIYNYGPNYGDVKVTDNYLTGSRMQGGAWTNAVVTNNTSISFGGQMFSLISSPVGNFLPWNVSRNRYHAANSLGQYFVPQGMAPVNFSNWKIITGYETNSQFFALPTTNYIIVRSNSYDTEKCSVVVYNHAVSATVNAGISSVTGWGVSDSVRVRSVENPFVDIVTNSLSGGSLTLNMLAASYSIAIPRGTNTAIAAKTFPNFGAFSIERLGTTNINTLTISSVLPSSGIVITNSPSDLNGTTETTTPGSLSCLFSDTFTLTAPTTSLVTNEFIRWDKNGVSFSTSNSITFNITANDTFSAVYSTPRPVTNSLYIISRRRPF